MQTDLQSQEISDHVLKVAAQEIGFTTTQIEDLIEQHSKDIVSKISLQNLQVKIQQTKIVTETKKQLSKQETINAFKLQQDNLMSRMDELLKNAHQDPQN